MTDIYNDNNLYWVFTKYAKERLANFDRNENLMLQVIKIGNYNWYADEDKKLGDEGYSEEAFKKYYQESYKDSLGNFITGTNSDGDTNVPLEFFIVSKELPQDRERVILSTTIDEGYGGFDIREIGVYERLADGDHLFAVCTLQPLPRPTTKTHHYISSEIKCHLYSQKLVTYFDNIKINKTTNYVTKPDLQSYQSNLLYVESNLAEQISRNSQMIGYNRVQQLYELIKENQDNYARFGLSAIYSSLANVADVKGFWPFNYSGNLSRKTMLKDLSLNNNNLGADQLSTRYEKGFEGIASWLNINNAHYYNLEAPSDIKIVTNPDSTKEYYAPNRDDLTFINLHKDDKGKVTSVSDSPFTVLWAGAQNNNSDENTLLCKYNTFTTHPGLKIVITPGRTCKVQLFTNSNSYVTFTTAPGSVPKAGTFYVLLISYNGDSENPKVSINIDGSEMNTSFTNTGAIYKGMTMAGIMLPLFSFERTGDGDKKYVNSKVCLLSLIKGNLSAAHKQSVVYNLMSLIGHNPCLV